MRQPIKFISEYVERSPMSYHFKHKMTLMDYRNCDESDLLELVSVDLARDLKWNFRAAAARPFVLVRNAVGTTINEDVTGLEDCYVDSVLKSFAVAGE